MFLRMVGEYLVTNNFSFLSKIFKRHHLQALTFSQTILTFKNPQERILLKTLREKAKMLVTSIFSFSNNVFYPIKDRNDHLGFICSVVCKCFQFGNVQIFVVWFSWSSGKEVNKTGLYGKRLKKVSVQMNHNLKQNR